MAQSDSTDVTNAIGGSTRAAVRTLAETYDISLADAARVYEGEANTSVHEDGILRPIDHDRELGAV